MREDDLFLFLFFLHRAMFINYLRSFYFAPSYIKLNRFNFLICIVALFTNFFFFFGLENSQIISFTRPCVQVATSLDLGHVAIF